MFRRLVYLLFSHYMSREKYLRYKAYINNTPPEIVDMEINKMYSVLTLFNMYKLAGDLSSMKSKDTQFINIDQSPGAIMESEKDFMKLAFDAMKLLPVNAVRQAAISANNSLEAVGDAKQTIGGMYASLLTDLSIYNDPTTAALLSGSLDDAFDPKSMGFPRRFAVQFDSRYMRKYKLEGELARWTCYRDPEFKDRYEGPEFEHEERINKTSWIWAAFKGIFEDNTAYLKLEIVSNDVVALTFYFKFTKGYISVNGIAHKLDPVTKDRIVRNGYLQEVDARGQIKATTFDTQTLEYATKSLRKVETPVVVSNYVSYTERVKAVALVTPPHKGHYQVHPLMIISQIINGIYGMSYVTKANRKPIIGTTMLLEEFGNIRYQGQGIKDIDQVASIALGQDLRIIFVLQSFQQLRSLYSEAVEDIIKANSAITIFLKSNDKTVIDEFVRQSGKRHEMRRNSRSSSRKPGDIITVGESTNNYTDSMVETTALTENNLLLLAGKSPGNAITFISNEEPLVNKGPTITPMAAGLHTRLPQPKTGVYSDVTLPTTSTMDIATATTNTIDAKKFVTELVGLAQIAMKVSKVFKQIRKENPITIPEGELADIIMNTVFDEYSAAAGVVQTEFQGTVELWEVAQELHERLQFLSDKSNPQQERQQYASAIRDILIRCTLIQELDELTKVYTKQTAKNVFGYEPAAVVGFINKMKETYPKPEEVETEEQNVFQMAEEERRNNPDAYRTFRGATREEDLYDADKVAEFTLDLIDTWQVSALTLCIKYSDSGSIANLGFTLKPTMDGDIAVYYQGTRIGSMMTDAEENIDWETLMIDDAKGTTALLAKNDAIVDFIAEEVMRSNTETPV